MSDVVVIKDRKGTRIGQITLNLGESTATVLFLKNQVTKINRITAIRQWLTIGENDKKIVLDDNQRLLSTYEGFKNGIEVTVKDIGPQLAWTTVFYAEYLGPILFYGSFYIAGCIKGEMKSSQKIGLVLGVAHYLKRLLETHFVHIFSRDSMPLASCWKNFLHYWLFFGTFIGVEYFLFYKDPGYGSIAKAAWVAAWAIAEAMNFLCHRHLATLRGDPNEKLEDGSSGNKKRQIPHGYGFDQVSCANYFWETLAWVAFSGFSRCWTSYFFTAVSFYQMLVWAQGKQRRYKKEFGKEFPKNRKAIIPYLL